MRELTPLRNGVRILFNRYNAPSVAVRLVLNGGSYDDPDNIPGLHHAYEHVIKRSTKTYPSTKLFNLRVDVTSPVWNGATDRCMVSFYGQTIPRKAVPLVKLLADLIVDHNISTEPVTFEQLRLKNERLEADDSIDSLVDERVDLQMLGRQLGRPIDGPDSVVKKYSPDVLRQLHRRLAVGRKVMIIVSGRFNPESVEQAIRRDFEILPAGKPTKRRMIVAPVHSSTHLVVDQTKEQVYFTIAWPTAGYNSPDRFAELVMRNYLSARDSSQVKDTVDFQGQGYSSTDFLEFYPGIGQYGLRLVVDRSSFLKTLRTVAREITRLRTELISKEELCVSKENIRLRTESFFWDPFNASQLYAEQLIIMGHCVPKPEFLREIIKVSRQRVQRAARRIFSPQRMVIAVAGPIRGLKKKDIQEALRFHQKP